MCPIRPIKSRFYSMLFFLFSVIFGALFEILGIIILFFSHRITSLAHITCLTNTQALDFPIATVPCTTRLLYRVAANFLFLSFSIIIMNRLFLEGLEKYGRGDWRNISRWSVKTRTPTQVASHAQKFFIRQANASSRGDSKRKSIHDITAP